MKNEMEILKRLHRRALSEIELLDIFYQSKDSYRILFHLIQQPKFPEKHSLNIIPKLYPMDLLKVIKNKRTPAGIRKRAEIEFVNKYHKYPMGEKLSYLRIAPNSLLNYFIDEKDRKVLETILKNIYCTEETILKFINRKSDRSSFYDALYETEWYKRPQVALSISYDMKAPIRIMIAIIPYLNLKQLERVYQNDETHNSVKQNIIHYLQNR